MKTFLFEYWGRWSPYWVHSALQPLLVYCTCPGWLWGWKSLWNERVWQERPKYSEKTCPDATLSTTNPTCQTRPRTRAATMGSQRLTPSAMSRPFHEDLQGSGCTDPRTYYFFLATCVGVILLIELLFSKWCNFPFFRLLFVYMC
jgi:hypothetical protein